MNCIRENFRKRWIKTTALAFVTFLSSCALFANPVLDNVSNGQVSFDSNTPNTLIVNQASDKAIINWTSFNIGQDETTRFVQPSSSSVALNRINPMQGASQIYGTLQANGQIILVNPSGIYFGPNAHVDVAGLIATTAQISDDSFLSGTYQFYDAGNGVISNRGEIIARDNGLVALLGSNVSNEGFIKANLGRVILASGDSYTISFDNLVAFAVGEPTSNSTKKIDNSGTLRADGGQIIVSAKTASTIVDNVINMKGVAEARSIGVRKGEIILSGGKGGYVAVRGKLDVSGKNAGGKGGHIQITGKNILVDSTAYLDATGDVGGGNIEIGGGAKGFGLIPHANAVVMLNGALIDASALTQGDGGHVVLWSDYFTSSHGTIYARGGAHGGNGGFIETSSENYLDILGTTVDLNAPLGQIGTWLLDPFADLEIKNAADSNVTASSPFQPTADTAVLDVNTLISALNTGADVIVQTTNNVAGATGTGKITVTDAINWNSEFGSLTLDAAGQIVINAQIKNFFFGVDWGSLILSAGSPTTLINVNAPIHTGNLTVKQGIYASDFSIGTLTSFAAITLGTATTAATLRDTNGTIGGVSLLNPITVKQGGATIDMSANSTTALQLRNTITLENGATLTLNVNDSTSQMIIRGPNGVIQGTGNVIKTGQGILSLASSNTYSGYTHLVNGRITASIFGTPADILPTTTALTIYNNSQFILSNDQTLGSLADDGLGSSTIRLQGNTLTIGNDNTSTSYSGLLQDGAAGNATLTKVGTGTLTLSKANTYTGTTNVNNGILALSNNDALGTSTVTVASGATLKLNGITLPSANTITLNGDGFNSDGALLGAGINTVNADIGLASAASIGTDNQLTINGHLIGFDNLTKLGSGTLTFTQSNTSYFGNTLLNQGIIAINAADSLGSGNIVFNGGTLKLNTDNMTINNNIVVNTPIQITDTNTITGTNNVTFTGIGTIGDLLEITNAGTTTFSGTLTGSNLYGLGINNATGTLILSGNTSGLTSYVKVDAGTLKLVTSNARFGVNLADSADANVITDNNAIVSIGTLTGGGNSGGNIALGDNAVLTIFQNADTDYSGIISGNNSSIVKDGTGTLQLSNSNTYTGGTTLHNGTLQINNDHALGTGTLVVDNNGATLAAGLNTTPTVANAIQINNGVTLNTATGSFDRLILNGLISGGGSIALLAGGLELGGNNLFTGGVTLAINTALRLTNANALGTQTSIDIPNGASLGLANSVNLGVNVNYLGNGSLVSFDGTNTLSGILSLNGLTSVVNFSSNDFTLSGLITGSGALRTVAFAAPIYITNANNYSGGTILQTGALYVGDNNALGSGPISFTGAGASLRASVPNLVLNNALDLSTSGIAQFEATNPFTITGPVVLENGVVNTMSSTNGLITLSGMISGSPTQLNLVGNGFIFSGHNTYSGGTDLNVQFMGVGFGDSLGTGTIIFQGDTSSPTLFGLSAGTLTFTNPYTFITQATFAGPANFDFTQGTTLTGDTTINITTPITVALDGNIDGVGPIHKEGPGTLALGGSNTYSGGTVLEGATTIVNSNTAFGTGTVQISGASIAAGVDNISLSNPFTVVGGSFGITGTHSITLSGAITNNSLIDVDNTSTTTLSGPLSGAGTLRLIANSGSLFVINNDNSAFTGDVVLAPNSGTLFVGSGFSNPLGTGTLFLNGGTLAANSDGVLLSNAYEVTGTAAIGGGSSIELSGNGKIFGTLNITNGDITTLSGNLSQTGTLDLQGPGSLILSGDNSIFSGNITLDGGTLNLNNSNALGVGPGVVTYNGGTFVNNVPLIDTNKNFVLNNTFTYNSSNNLAIHGFVSGAGSISKDGAGTLTLSNTNAYSGGTTLLGGIIDALNDGALGSGLLTLVSGSLTNTVSGLTVTLNNPFQVVGNSAIGSVNSLGNFNFTGNGTLNAELTNVNFGDVTFSGTLTGAGGSIVQSAPTTLTLLGNNNFDGGVTQNSGTLAIGNDNALGTGLYTYNGGVFTTLVDNLIVPNNIDLFATLLLNSNFNLTLTGDIAQNGGITKGGSGNLTLSGNNTFGGATTINSGTLTTNSNNALGSTGGSTVINTGGTLAVNDSVNLANEAITINGGSLIGNGVSSVNGPIFILTSTTITSATSGGNFSLNGAIDTLDGSQSLSLNGPGNISLGGVVGGLESLNTFTANAPQLILNNAVIHSSGNQQYNSVVVLGSGTSNVILDGGANSNISFSSGITGGNNLDVTGNAGNNTFLFATSLVANNVTINGGGGTNALRFLIPTTQTWDIGNANAGSITASGFNSTTFSNIQNITSGPFNDVFNFTSGGLISGIIAGGGGYDTLNYKNFGSAISVAMSDPSSGTGATYNSNNVVNNALDPSTTITSFTNFGKVIGNDTGFFLVPPAKQFAIVLTAQRAFSNLYISGTGYVSDPIDFDLFLFPTNSIFSPVLDPTVNYVFIPDGIYPLDPFTPVIIPLLPDWDPFDGYGCI